MTQQKVFEFLCSPIIQRVYKEVLRKDQEKSNASYNSLERKVFEFLCCHNNP